MNRGIIVLAGLVMLAVYYFSNQETNPYSGKSEFNTISIAQASQLGAQSYQQILQQQRGDVLCPTLSAGACNDEALEVVTTVRDIGARLQKAAIEYEQDLLDAGWSFTPVARDFDWTYNVIQSEQPNAFCLPGGYVAVYTGIMDITGNNDGRVTLADLEDPDKLAVVMGHEIGHAMAHHGAKRMSQGQLAQLGMAAVAVGVGDMDPGQRQMVMQAMGVAAQGGMMAFSRQHETEADKIGLELLVRACYDPREAPELWERMGKAGGQRPPEWMSTHPASETRAQNFREWMSEAIAQYEQNCGPLR
ncbi:M48 family metallopeptidase [Henriciella mobilis]|uniref:M48 family peptidase n=1 Tax=Henriciella mobilis TaxID=2305467 RepID=A0A399RS68_9PROT|nr:M48 family metallopeptidase [Henriciella mobilis]RIJ32839.1 M48 family peptidase [Henriciella mobilis]